MSSFWQNLKKPIIGLSPMDGVTDEPMRQTQTLVAKPDVMYTEFVSIEGFIRRPEKFKRQLSFQENERPIIAQIFGSNPETFSNVIPEIAALGFDGIDINMGCPAKSIVEHGGGAALIGNFPLVEKILLSSLKAIKKSGLPLSLKTRIGKSPEDSRNWFYFLSNYPLSEVAIHGRPITQGSSGPVNWDEIAAAAEIIKSKEILALGNGGIKSLEEAEEKSKQHGLDGILIGQASFGNPWIFKKNYTPNKQEIMDTMLKHAELAWNFYGERGFPTVRKHLGWYCKNLPNSKQLKISLLQTKNLQEVKEILKTWKKS